MTYRCANLIGCFPYYDFDCIFIAVQKSKNYCGGNYLSVTVICNMKCHEKCVLLLLLLFGQVDQQDVPITGQTSKRQSKNKTKRSNHQTVIRKQQNYSNPFHATSILLQVSNERVEIAPVNSIDATTKYVNHTLNVLIINWSSSGRPATTIRPTSQHMGSETVTRSSSRPFVFKMPLLQIIEIDELSVNSTGSWHRSRTSHMRTEIRYIKIA
jgi:hypothetical protein